MQFGRAITWIAVTSILFAIIGATVGYLIGAKMPGYYRSVFEGGDSAHFDPIAVGFGQGLTQGMALGVTIGLVLVLAGWWKEAKLAALALEEKRSQPHNYSLGSPVAEPDTEIQLRS